MVIGSRSSWQHPLRFAAGGDEGNRTLDPLLAGQVLSQLSYTPDWVLKINDLQKLNSKSKLELCSNLSSNGFAYFRIRKTSLELFPILHRKEVIQPHLPIRLPCYDLTPITEPTFDSCLLAVSPLASGVSNFHGLTGGVYKARERIHRGMLIRDY